MKRFLISICSAALIMTGCKEKDPVLIFIGPPAADTTYLGTVPTVIQPHNVLIEEFTGQGCSACPSAHSMLDAIESMVGNEGRINIVSMYFNGGPQTVPPKDNKYDFRNTIATNISLAIYGAISQLPSGSIDRTPSSGLLDLLPPAWSSLINSQKAMADSINLDVKSTFSGGKATITVTVQYAYNISTKQNLSVYILEDSLIDIQEDGIKFDTFYLFKDIFRDMVSTPNLGDPILNSMATKPAGQVYIRRYTYTPSSSIINVGKCRVVAFINNPGGTGSDYKVLQSVQCRLIP